MRTRLDQVRHRLRSSNNGDKAVEISKEYGSIWKQLQTRNPPSIDKALAFNVSGTGIYLPNEEIVFGAKFRAGRLIDETQIR